MKSTNARRPVSLLAAIALAVLSVSAYAVDERNPEQREPNAPSTHPQFGRSQATGDASQARANMSARTDTASSQGATSAQSMQRQPRTSSMRDNVSPDFIRNGFTYPEGNRAFGRIGTP